MLKLKFRRTEKVAKDIECIGLHLNAWVVPEDVNNNNNNNNKKHLSAKSLKPCVQKAALGASAWHRE